MIAVDRPLGLSEILAETVRLYGERLWAALGIGALVAAVFLVTIVVPPVLALGLGSLAFTASYAAAARLVSGDAFTEAWAQVGLRLPVLALLTLVVSVPFAIAMRYLLLMLVAVCWLALVGFSIPITMVEREPGEGMFEWLGHALQRSVSLARAEYLHAVGIAAALLILYLLVGVVLAQALAGFADQTSTAAVVLAQVVLAPFFFIGLSVLYFEQRARALSSSAHSS